MGLAFPMFLGKPTVIFARQMIYIYIYVERWQVPNGKWRKSGQQRSRQSFNGEMNNIPHRHNNLVGRNSFVFGIYKREGTQYPRSHLFTFCETHFPFVRIFVVEFAVGCGKSVTVSRLVCNEWISLSLSLCGWVFLCEWKKSINAVPPSSRLWRRPISLHIACFEFTSNSQLYKVELWTERKKIINDWIWNVIFTFRIFFFSWRVFPSEFSVMHI